METTKINVQKGDTDKIKSSIKKTAMTQIKEALSQVTKGVFLF